MADFSSSHEGLRELALFAGAGGGILAGQLLGWRTVCAVEREAYPAQVLAARQNDGTFETFPIWSDVTSFDGRPWRGIVDVVSGGFPCQDISSARTNNGGKATGLDGAKSGLWSEFKRIIEEVQPRYAFIENSAHLRTKGLNAVLKGLTDIGYNAVWGVLSAKDCNANHERKRMWILAERQSDATDSNEYSESDGSINAEAQRLQRTYEISTYTNSAQRKGRGISSRGYEEHSNSELENWWSSAPELYRVDDGVAYGSHRLKAIGNGQVPIVAASAFLQLKRCLDNYNSN